MIQSVSPLVSGPWCHECLSESSAAEDKDIIDGNSTKGHVGNGFLFRGDDEENKEPINITAASRRSRNSKNSIVSRSVSTKHILNDRSSSPLSVTRFPSRCLRIRSDARLSSCRSTLAKDGVQDESTIRIAPRSLLDAFEAERNDQDTVMRQLSASTDRSSGTADSLKSVRFAHPLVSSIKECPPRVRSRIARERLFYSARDVRRFKKERRQVRFLCRMAGFHEDDTQNNTSSEESSTSEDEEDDFENVKKTMSRHRQKGLKNGKTVFVPKPSVSARRRNCNNKRRQAKEDEKTLCTPFSKVLLQNLFLLNDDLFDSATQ